METVQVFIKTEEEDQKEDVGAQHNYLHPEETPCSEPVKSERQVLFQFFAGRTPGPGSLSIVDK
jgi:hypothetical protein